MRWQSWSEFWAMGGYAWYVWGSVGVTFLGLMLEVWWARSVQRSTLAQLQAQYFVTNLSDEDLAE